MKKFFFAAFACALLFIFSFKGFSQTAIVIDSASTWNYFTGSAQPANDPQGDSWNSLDYAHGWSSGTAKLGFGGDGEVSCIPAGATCTGCVPGGVCAKYTTTYFRKNFTLVNKNSYTGFIIRMLRDDGAVVYVNGVEVWRSNMPGGTISYTTFAAANTGDNAADEYTFFQSPVISNTAFQTGDNVIAVEVHQSNSASSDLGFNLQLAGQLTGGSTLLPLGSTWKYWANAQANMPAGWNASAFNDAAWASGAGRLGFGDPVTTCVPAGFSCTGCNPGTGCTKYTTTYFRTTVNIPNVTQYNGFFINMTRDDGAVVYVNGVEVWRSGMPAGPIIYSTYALTDPLMESNGPNETAIFTSPVLSPSLFQNGANVIAVEVHQVNDISSDLGLDLSLVGQLRSALLSFGSTWKYWANTAANYPTGWETTGFNDVSPNLWPSGAARLGYGDDGEVTAIPAGCGSLGNPGNCTPKFTTTYFRTTVNISNVTDYTGFKLNLIRDDGAVVYVNGTEVWRNNMPGTPGTPVSYSTFASVLVTTDAEEAEVHTITLPASAPFVNGNNLIAIEIHQINSTSSDLGMDFSLEGLYSSSPVNEVVYMWSGALTFTSAKVNAKLTSATTQARLLASNSPMLTSPLYGPYYPSNGIHNNVAALSINGLTPNTKYYYAIESDGVVDNSADDIGSFTTPTGLPAYSYKFTVGGCALSSNHPVYDQMAAKNPLFFVALGDFHYANPNSGSDINVHRTPYETNMLSQTASRNFFKNVPLAYVWDDHDFSGNDSDSTAAGKTNARLAYQEYMPHYPLASGTGNVPIYQAFTVGRVRFIMTDLRSTRKQGAVIWDATQKQWFKNECLYAKNNNLTIAWVNTVSFGGSNGDNWGGYNAERTEISDFFRDNNIQHMFIMSGDAHMLAIDNGANHDFSTGSTNPFNYPVFAAAAMNQNGSYKGGTYNVRPDSTVDGGNHYFINPSSSDGQYGLVEVTDNGVNICINFRGYRVSSGGVETILTAYNFCRAAGTTLPIKLASFTAKPVNHEKAQLAWEVSEQVNCGKYSVERSTDGIRFTSIAEVACHAANSYSFSDANALTGDNYYRIKMTEADGAFNYTQVHKVTLTRKNALTIAPNPIKDDLKFKLTNIAVALKASYFIYDISGKKHAEGNVMLNAGVNNVSVTLPKLGAGSYMLKLAIGEKQFMEHFVVQ